MKLINGCLYQLQCYGHGYFDDIPSKVQWHSQKIDFYINQQYRFHVIKNIFNPVLDKQKYF